MTMTEIQNTTPATETSPTFAEGDLVIIRSTRACATVKTVNEVTVVVEFVDGSTRLYAPADLMPAVERITPGVGFQTVNVVDPRTGLFSHQLHHRGTELQARAQAEIGFTHESTHAERRVYLIAVILGRFPGTDVPLPTGRAELIAHTETCPLCETDEPGGWDGLDTEEIAQFVLAAHAGK